MSDSLVRVSRRAEWEAHGPAGSARSAEARRDARAARPRSRRRRLRGHIHGRAWAAAAIRVGPRPESIGGPALTVPHPARAHRRPHPLPSRQFQALFDSLFKVLFIFPSRYLFAIGLSPVFSLGRNLPPDWGCIPKQPDSPTAPRGATGSGHDGALTLSGAPFHLFGQPGGEAPGRPSSATPEDRALAALRDARAACPRLAAGRNLRSKTRWFTGLRNSHQVSHFATFFIDARAEISVAESRFGCTFLNGKRRGIWEIGAVPGRRRRASLSFTFLGAQGAGVSVAGGGLGRAFALPRRIGGVRSNRFAGRSFCVGTTMILPQVHLRKPCYDFSFL
ncbi:hypothetical protein K1719_047400 [Acacia pycnantha]|nr:hypothetical protein K1719_047400 [Acacia pycnantha]